MSSHGPPADPYRPHPGPAADPYRPYPAPPVGPNRPHPGLAADPYRPHPASSAAGGYDPPPSDPWGDAAPPPPYLPPPFPTVPPAEPPPPPTTRRNLWLYLTVAVLVVLAAAGVGYALYLLSGTDNGGGVAAPSAGTTPSSSGTPTAPATQENLGMSAVMAQVGDCLVNDGSVEDPQMRIVACDTDESDQVFEILEVINERVRDDQDPNDQAQAMCAETDGYTHHYYEVGESASFVLCMAEHG